MAVPPTHLGGLETHDRKVLISYTVRCKLRLRQTKEVLSQATFTARGLRLYPGRGLAATCLKFETQSASVSSAWWGAFRREINLQPFALGSCDGLVGRVTASAIASASLKVILL